MFTTPTSSRLLYIALATMIHYLQSLLPLAMVLVVMTPTVDAFSRQEMKPGHRRRRRRYNYHAIISTTTTNNAIMSRIRSNRIPALKPRLCSSSGSSPFASSSDAVSSSSLFGIAEWREHFTSVLLTQSSLSLSSSPPTTLPLLLLPFPPTQILLPGQSTTLQFKHGKYMDLIDDALTNYYGVVGFSVLDDDGLLPIVVLCEIIEETLDVKMGYRGFSSMEVGLRAVGRARRIVGGLADKGRSTSGISSEGIVSSSDDEVVDSSYLYGRKKTAIEDIHLGQCEEWRDNDIIAKPEDLDAALECVSNIESLLMTASLTTQRQQQQKSMDDGMMQRRMLFDKSYEAMLQHADASSSCPDPSNISNSSCVHQHQNHLEAISWASLAACDVFPRSSPSIVMRALEAKDTLERLRLGLAMLLECQVSPWGNGDSYAREIGTDAVDDYHGNSFQ